MDIKETPIPGVLTPSPEAQTEDNDPTIGELLGKHQDELTANDAIHAQYDLAENKDKKMKENTTTPAFVSNGKSESDLFADNERVKTMLDRMKALTGIKTEKPTIQWDAAGISSGGLMDAAKEVSPDDPTRAVTTTGAPSVEVLKQELRPENPIITKGTPKADSSSTTSKPTAAPEKSEGEKTKPASGKPWEKKEEVKDETPAKEDDEEKEKVDESVEDAIEEVTTHHLGAQGRNVGLDITEEEEEEVVEVAAGGLSDSDILESENTELMYEAMVRYKADPAKFIMFKRKLDETNTSRRLNEAVRKMRARF